MGASSLLKDFSEKSLISALRTHIASSISKNPDDWIIAQDGGSGLFLSPMQNAEAIKEKLYTEFEFLTVNAEIVISYMEITPGDLETNFKAIVSKLINLSKIEAMRRTGAGIVSIPPFLHKCDSCGVFPSIPSSVLDYEDRICASCIEKREKMREALKNVNSEDESKIATAKTFHDLVVSPDGTQDANESMAIFYSDGNDMGRIFNEKLEAGIYEYSKFSKGLSEHIQNCMKATCDELKVDRIDISFGGDDIFIALRASQSIQFLESLKKHLSLHPDNDIASIGYSFALIFTKCKYPIRFLMDYAETLLKSAKKVCYREKAKSVKMPSFAIDFLTIKESSPLSHHLEHLRNNYTNISRKTRLSKKPYSFEEYQILLSKAKILKQAAKESKSQLNIIADAIINQIPEETKLTVDYYFAKLKDSGTPLSKLIEDSLNPSLYDSLIQTSTNSNGVNETYFFDALELSDFIEEDKSKDKSYENNK